MIIYLYQFTTGKKNESLLIPLHKVRHFAGIKSGFWANYTKKISHTWDETQSWTETETAEWEAQNWVKIRQTLLPGWKQFHIRIRLSTALRCTVVNSTASARSLPDKVFKANWGFQMCCSSSYEEAHRNGRHEDRRCSGWPGKPSTADERPNKLIALQKMSQQCNHLRTGRNQWNTREASSEVSYRKSGRQKAKPPTWNPGQATEESRKSQELGCRKRTAEYLDQGRPKSVL